jgi:methylated-DNA-[protein]-cysteine S-methyltransferase
MKTSHRFVTARYESALGPMLLAASDRGLAGVWFEGQRHMPDASGWSCEPGHAVLHQAMTQLAEYFAGRRGTFDLSLDLDRGTPFQQSVWQALLAIPCGQRISYGTLSQRIGRPAAVRAVGAAVGRNPVSIVVPCHRVLGTDGSLTGYAGGVHRKTALLQLEGMA